VSEKEEVPGRAATAKAEEEGHGVGAGGETWLRVKQDGATCGCECM